MQSRVRLQARRSTASSLCNGASGLSTRFLARRRIRLRFRPFANGEMARFAGRTVSELKDWLEKHDLPTGSFGQGSCKSLDDLFTEVEKGETELVVADGKIKRRLEVLNLLVSTPGLDKVLMEEQQIMPNGAVRRRGLPLAEKLLPNEDWQAGVQRAIQEELGSINGGECPRHQIRVSEYQQSEETWVSASYPGLETTAVHHTAPVEVHGLPHTDFWTSEERPAGVLKTHWVWVDAFGLPKKGGA